ncbi:hypothetical protein GW17_00050214 [Ensete ventricosum]|nr:hypothetical protein GW17_00050214 [Ensete ventricosum]
MPAPLSDSFPCISMSVSPKRLRPISPPTLPLSSSLTLPLLPSAPVASSRIRQKQRSLASTTVAMQPRHHPLSLVRDSPSSLSAFSFSTGLTVINRRSPKLQPLPSQASGSRCPPHQHRRDNQPPIAESSGLAFPWDLDALGLQPPARCRSLRQQSSATATTFDLYISLLLSPLSTPIAQVVAVAVTAVVLLFPLRTPELHYVTRSFPLCSISD